jgi:hypothetical protein
MKYNIIKWLVCIIIVLVLALTYKIAIAEPFTCDEYEDIKLYSECLITQKWGNEEWLAFEWVIQKESNWIYTAKNPNSSAYGLPQALTKLHDLPDDYMTNPRSQIDWGISYIEDRYGVPSKAKAFHVRNNFY